MTSHSERPRTDGVRPPTAWLLRAGRPLAQWLVRRYWDVRVVNPERVPATGPVILASNHIAFIDGPLLAIFAPRPVHVLTKIEMFKAGLGRFLLLSGQIPLDRYHYDPHAVRLSIRALRDGATIAIYPEGARGGGDLRRFHRGAAYLALVTGAPVVPVVMIGSRESGAETTKPPKRGHHIDLVFGDPIELTAVPWPRTRQAVAEASRMLRAAMLTNLQAALDESGRSLPGPLPAGQYEPDPGGGVTEQSA